MAAKLETGRSRCHVGLENREYIMEINDNRILSMLVYDYCIIYIYICYKLHIHIYIYIYIININKGIYPLGDIPYIYIYIYYRLVLRSRGPSSGGWIDPFLH